MSKNLTLTITVISFAFFLSPINKTYTLNMEEKTNKANTKLKNTLKKVERSLSKEEEIQKSIPKEIMLATSDGAEINFKTEHEIAPIFIATGLANKALIKFLIKNKADINLSTEDGINPLLIALGYYFATKNNLILSEFKIFQPEKYLETIKLLIKNNAKLNPKISRKKISLELLDNIEELENLIKNIFSEELLHKILIFLTKINYISGFKALLKNQDNINLNIKDSNGNYLIHNAILNENPAMVELLLNNNIDLTLENSDQLSPEDLAEIIANQEIIDLLKNHQLEQNIEPNNFIDLESLKINF